VETLERRGADGIRVAPRGGWLDRGRTVAGPHFNRWLLPPAALAIHLSIGMAYGFSVFWLPLSKALPGAPACTATAGWISELTAGCNWRVESVNITFILFTVVLGLAAAVWGNWVERVGPRKSAVVAAACWCGGLALGSIAINLHQLWLFWLGTGVIGGIGLGLGYLSPISVLIRWFPDRRGMATGMAVMGFGGGAMVGAPLAVMLMRHFQTPGEPGVAATFLALAVIYATFMLGGAFGYRLPPRGWRPTGWVPPKDGPVTLSHSVHVSRAWKTPTFWCIWGALCMNISAGIGVLSMASPMLQEIFGGRLLGNDLGIDALNADQHAQIAIIAVGFTGILSLFNIAGRFFWAVLSDRIGRRNTFYCFFLIGIPLYAAMPVLGAGGHIILFVAGFCVIMSMFGGAFATVPAYLSDMFGTEMVSAIQGRVLTAWSTAGVIGPLLMSAIRNQQIESSTALARAYDPAFYLLAGLLFAGLVCNALVRPVAERHFMTSTELEKHRYEIRYHGVRAPSTAPILATPAALSAGAVAVWLAVCLPLAWGIWMTVQRAAVFL
jgi:MFS family permease